MKKEIFLPQVELNMERVTVARWLVKVGDRVQAEQAIMEVETQKAVVEVPSSESGHVRKLFVKEGDSIGEKALLCVLTDSTDEPFEVAGTERDKLLAVSGQQSEPTQPSAPSTPSSVLSPLPSDAEGVRAAPAARKLARDLGINLAILKGTGPGGRITVEDVEGKAEGRRRNAEDGGMKVEGERIGEGWKALPASRMALIEQMQKSLKEIPQIHIVRFMDVTPLSAKAEGITFTHRLASATAAALVSHPTLRTILNGSRVKVEPVSVAIAMDTPGGLVAPVLRDADRLSLQQIATTIRAFRTRAEAAALKREELVDAPFAITNLGMFGVDFFNAFVFHGQTAVLAVGRATEGASGRKQAWFSLAVDHRIVDGAEAARFLETLQKKILAP